MSWGNLFRKISVKYLGRAIAGSLNGGIIMKGSHFKGAVIACVAVWMASIGSPLAAELRLLAGGAMATEWAAIKPQFEKASGHTLEIFFGTTPNLIKEATSGKPFDVGVVPVDVMQ